MMFSAAQAMRSQLDMRPTMAANASPSSAGNAAPVGVVPKYGCLDQGGASNGLGNCQGGLVVRGAARADLHEAGCPLTIPGHRLCQALQEAHHGTE